MIHKHTFPQEFIDLYNKYHNSDKGLKCLKIEGIDRDKLDIPAMSRAYFSNDHTADVSVDANSNANAGENKSHNNYVAEITKPTIKLENYYLIYRELEKQYGTEKAVTLLSRIYSGNYYFHDSTATQIPYCIAVSTSRLMVEGRTWGQLKSLPPKRAKSFIAQCIETVMDLSQEFAGAVTPSDMIINYAYYAKKENLTKKEIENDFQSFVHIVNNAYRVSGQSPFTNISLFDKNNLNLLFDNYTYPDGSKPDFEYITKLQYIFANFFSKGDPCTDGGVYRFPVVTFTFLIDEKNNCPIDMEFLENVCKYNFEKANFNIYLSNSVGKVASCCFTGETRFKYYNNENVLIETTMDEFVHRILYEDGEIKVNTGIFIDSINKDTLEMEKTEITGVLKKTVEEIIDITLQNDYTINVTTDHIFLVKNILTDELEEVASENLLLNPLDYEMMLDGNLFEPIKKIELKTETTTVYDIELEKNHFFYANNILTHNCRLVNDFSLLTGINSFGAGAGITIGSHRVVTINLPRLAIQYKQKHDVYEFENFKPMLDETIQDTHDLLKAHRSLLHKRAGKGFLKFIKPLNFFNIDKHLFSTFGINGMYEMMYFLFNGKIFDENNKLKREVIDFEKEIISYINNKVMSYAKEENLPYNLEEVPAESVAIKFAEKDKIMFSEEIQIFDLYSNQFVPLIEDIDIYERIKIESEFNKSLSGGSIVHLNLKSRLKNSEDMKKLIYFALENELEHFAINYDFNICESGHHTVGSNLETVCPICSKPITERITRVVGYYTPVSSWSKVRRTVEFKKRKFS